MSTSKAFSRRNLLRGTVGCAAVWFTTPGLFAEELTRTPTANEGPFYPSKLPLDTDNDLVVINDAVTPAVGEITHLTGRILDAKGEPLRNTTIEIWQCDKDGTYLKQYTQNQQEFDTNFQGYGRFLTGSTGEFYFRTIKPVPYRGRPAVPHPRAVMEGKQEIADDRVLRQRVRRKRKGRPVPPDS